MRRILVVAVLLACSAPAGAAPRRTVRGVVTEAGSAAPIAGASVLAEHGGGALTEVDGSFVLQVDARDRKLTVIAVGYATRTVRIGRGRLQIALRPASGGEIIEVTGTAPDDTRAPSHQLTVDDIRTIPGAGNDILRAAQALPGVARIPFSFGGLVLRGASPRDTSVYLDGIEVPIAFHFGGITSFYPSGMLADLQVTAGGFDASYGRAQGGLVTLTTREPRTDRWHGGGSIGLFDSSVQVEGPVAGGGGLLIGLRRSYFDQVARPFVEDGTPLPSYWDFQIRTGWGDANRGGRITPMIFGSIDRVTGEDVTLTSMFIRVAASYVRRWGPTTLRVVPWVGTNRLTFTDDEGGGDPESVSRPVYPAGLRAELVRDALWGHVRGGVDLDGGYLSATQFNVEDGDGPSWRNGRSRQAWTNVALWVEGRRKLAGERIAIRPGLRIEAYGLAAGKPLSESPLVEPGGGERPQIVIDPRLGIHQKITDWLTLRQTLGRFHQPPTPADVGQHDGNPGLDGSYVDQASLGVDARLPHEIGASATGFYGYGRRQMIKAQDPRPGARSPELNLGGLGPTFELLLEKQLGIPIYRENLGRSRMLGVEVAARRRSGRWFTMLSYTLQQAERSDERRLWDWRPFELDQRHNLQLIASVQLTHWRLGARMQLVSGNPYSPTHIEIVDGNPFPVQDPWAGTLPAFFSLDLRADRRWRRCWGDIQLYIDVQNATRRRNVEGRDFDYSEGRDLDIVGLPLIPFIGVEFLPLR